MSIKYDYSEEYADYQAFLTAFAKNPAKAISCLDETHFATKQLNVRVPAWLMLILKTISGNQQSPIGNTLEELVCDYAKSNKDSFKPLHPKGYENSVIKGNKSPF